jgi:hypothetical protein
MMAYFAWSAATTDRWNSFDWQMFLARIHSPPFPVGEFLGLELAGNRRWRGRYLVSLAECRDAESNRIDNRKTARFM